jgi:Flp pilus assembly protein TadB
MVNTLLLNIGDSVIILGKQHRQRETATFPMLIMHSETQTLLFSREPETNQWSASDTALSIVYVIGLFIIAITYLIQFLSTNWFHWILLDVAAVVIFLVFFVIVMYQRYLRRERVVHFDSQGWEHVVNIINNRFHFGS